MTLSYKWLCDYLPKNDIPSPEKLSEILTSIGLEVESMDTSGSVRGGLQGLITGVVLECEKHPDADKLKVAKVSTGNETLQIVCGASNIAAGQKVVVAPVNSTIYPVSGGEIHIKKAKIRGIESQGMICAEDEIGIGTDHNGIIVLPAETVPGTAVSEIYNLEDDYIFEIGLTPNRIDAMSHTGVAKDVAAWLSYSLNKNVSAILPYQDILIPEGTSPVQVRIEDTNACKRYSGILISNINVGHSPEWMVEKLKSIGVKSVNNIVDITNFILHETGQPLHAFDADKITGNTIIVKTLAADTAFITLDNKERKLGNQDLMICNSVNPMCIAGVYGGLESGVSESTKNIFIESAWFHPSFIRRTSLAHNLRTDAASRFEKGTDISNTVNVLKRAASLILSLCGGNIEGEIIDVYPHPEAKKTIEVTYSYIRRLSGKEYSPNSVTTILEKLGFDIIESNEEKINVAVPFSKPDVSLPADIVEEIMRIDGLDNIIIPGTINISPSVDNNHTAFNLRERIAGSLSGEGFYEIFTNSITNSKWYGNNLKSGVKMINSLSSELDIMRPYMLQSGLEVIAYNINRKNNDLKFYEFGKTYEKNAAGFIETTHLTVYITGAINVPDWNHKEISTDFYVIKGIAQKIINLTGLDNVLYQKAENIHLNNCLDIYIKNKRVGILGEVAISELKSHDIKQPVFYIDLLWEELLSSRIELKDSYKEISKFPAAQRDLAIVVNKKTAFAEIEKATAGANISQLSAVELFDVFESEKLGAGKKSLAINYTFTDDSKTLTDKEIDTMMNKLINTYEKELDAEIRKK